MKRIRRLLIAGFLVAGTWATTADAGQHSLGGGIHYLVTVDSIDAEGFDEDSVGYLLSYQFTSGFTSLELDLEYFPERFGGFEDSAWAPQAFLVLGSNLYGALGIGKYYENDDWSEAFYVLRLGLDIPIFESLSIDIGR